MKWNKMSVSFFVYFNLFSPRKVKNFKNKVKLRKIQGERDLF